MYRVLKDVEYLECYPGEVSAGVYQSLPHPTVADQGESVECQSYQTVSLYPTTKGRSREHSRNRAGFGVGRRADHQGRWGNDVITDQGPHAVPVNSCRDE